MHWINDKLNEHFIHTIMKLLMLFIAMMFPIHTWLLSTKDDYSRPFDFESRQDIGLREKVNKLRNDLPLFNQPIHGHTFLYLIGISSDKYSFLANEVAYICSPVMGDFRKI